MKQKSILLFALCALLLLGCLGCGEKTVAVPLLHPITLPLSDAGDQEYSFNITPEAFVKSFNVYCKGRNVTPLENGKVFKASEKYNSDQLSYWLPEDEDPGTAIAISLFSFPKTKNLTSVMFVIPTPVDDEKARNTCDVLFDYSLEVLEPNKGKKLKDDVYAFLSEHAYLADCDPDDPDNLEFIFFDGENSYIYIEVSPRGQFIFIHAQDQ